MNKDQVKELLDKLKTDRSPGPDKIHNNVLYEAREVLAIPITNIFRRSLGSGNVPAMWKVAEVDPVHKKGRKNDPNNYRPVSLTSCMYKILETIVTDQIMSHLKENNMLSDQQHGFSRGRSCCTRLLEVINDWSESSDRGHPLEAIYLDYRKAFESVPHHRLLEKLSKYGIKGKILIG